MTIDPEIHNEELINMNSQLLSKLTFKLTIRNTYQYNTFNLDQ